MTRGAGILALVLLSGAAWAETDTPVTLERVEGALQDLEVFDVDGPYHVWLQEVTVTVRTVAGRPLTQQEKAESQVIAVTCADGAIASNLSEEDRSDGAYVLRFTCESG